MTASLDLCGMVATPEDMRDQLAAHAITDPDDARVQLDRFLHWVLGRIAAGEPQPQQLAEAALTVASAPLDWGQPL